MPAKITPENSRKRKKPPLLFIVSTAPGRKNRLFELGKAIHDAGHPILAVTDREKSCQKNHWRCLELGLRVGSGPFTILEDDVVPAAGAIEYIARWPYHLFPSLALTAWFDQLLSRGTSEHHPWTLHTRDCREFLYSQAVTYSTPAARQCLRSPLVAHHDDPHGGDRLIGQILTGQRWGIHIPNLFQHVGTMSLTNPYRAGRGEIVTSTTFPGDDFHASMLGNRIWQSAQRRLENRG